MQPFEGEVELVCCPKTTHVPTLIEEAKDADAMIIANMPMPGEVIEACPKLQFIDVAFTGVDHVGLEAAKAKGVKVSNASGYSNEAVAELVIGMALSMLRNIPQTEARVRSGGTKDGLVGRELRGKTVGIIGYGNIGSRSGELFHAFGCHVLAQSRRIHDDYPAFVEQVGQDELLRRSDIVVLHCPLNDSTRGMINYEKLQLMKKSAILINVARGAVTDEGAVADAVESGHLGGIGIDVFSAEPLPEEHPYHRITDQDNVILTPHTAWGSLEARNRVIREMAENIRAFYEGRERNRVDK